MNTRTEVALAQALERYEPFIQASPLGVAMLDLQRRYRRVNDVLCELLERTEDELLDLRWDDVVQPDDVAAATVFGAGVRAMGLTSSMECRYLLPDGEVVLVLLGVSALEEDGEPVGYLNVVADLTERYESERRLEREATNVQVLKEVAVAANEAASIEEVMRRTIDLVCGHTGWPVGHAFLVDHDGVAYATGIWHLDEPERFRSFVDVTNGITFHRGIGLPGRVLASGRPEWLDDPAGDPSFIRGQRAADIGVHAGFAFPLLSGSEVVGVLEFFTAKRPRADEALLDLVAHIGTNLGRVVERVRAAEATAAALAREHQAAEDLRALDELKNTFLSAVSHDLRSPLSSVVGFAGILAESWDKIDDEQRREFIGAIVRGAEKLDGLLRDLLDIDRIKRGVAEAERAPVELDRLVRRLAQGSPLFASGRLEVRAEPILASVEAGKVERIVENLLANAGKYTPPGTQVWLLVRADQRDVEIVVEDAGPGVPEAIRGTAFDPFTRGSDDTVPGTGIGLTLVARFAELHGGRAWAEDRAGGGARFVVRLPNAVEQPDG